VIRILVVYEHQLIGDIITAALQAEADIQVIGYAATPEAVFSRLQETSCDIVVVSIELPENAALQLTHRLFEQYNQVKVLITDLIRSTTAVLQCIEAGAAGYVYTDESLSDLLKKVRALHRDEFPVAPGVASGLMNRLAELKRLAETEKENRLPVRTNQCEDLTAREREVLSLMAKGHTNQEIAEALIIEVGTVKNHVHNIFRKLDIQHREHATFFAQQLL
jgi:two-component system, NarL family, response regulator LiaR